jgi:hypothetical protein
MSKFVVARYVAGNRTLFVIYCLLQVRKPIFALCLIFDQVSEGLKMFIGIPECILLVLSTKETAGMRRNDIVPPERK